MSYDYERKSLFISYIMYITSRVNNKIKILLKNKDNRTSNKLDGTII